jgi:hypothetical protein
MNEALDFGGGLDVNVLLALLDQFRSTLRAVAR